MEHLIGPLDQAIHDTVHEFVDPRDRRRRGAVGLAAVIGMQPGTLSNKANPLCENHHLSLRESVPVQLSSGDFRILYTFAQVLGHCAYMLPEADEGGDVALLDSYAEFHARLGQKSELIKAALQDGAIAPSELAGIRASFDGCVRAGLGLLQRLEALSA